MDRKQPSAASDSENLKLELLVNDPSDGIFQSNQMFSIWKKLFPESKTLLMSELEDCINKIEEVGCNKD